jgi:two-component system response regulator CpxR
MSVTVALVEDDADISDLMREVLEIDGFEVVMFSEPDPPKIAALEPPPALFLIDIMLPGMNGVELAEHLRRGAYPDTPMIAMSASRLMLERASASGLFQDTMAKPFNLSTLLSRVEDLVQARNGSASAPR